MTDLDRTAVEPLGYDGDLLRDMLRSIRSRGASHIGHQWVQRNVRCGGGKARRLIHLAQDRDWLDVIPDGGRYLVLIPADRIDEAIEQTRAEEEGRG